MTYPGRTHGASPASTTGFSQPSIPLTPEVDVDRQASMGALVKEATTHLSTLIRAEVELAKSELTVTVKQGVQGAVFFIVAGVIGLFSLFFLFLMIGEILDIWLPRWLAFVIVFLLMVVLAGLLVLVGLGKIKKMQKPEKTITSLQDTATTLRAAASHPDPGVKV